MRLQSQRSTGSFRFTRMRQALVVVGSIALGAIPTAVGFIMWHNAQMETVGTAWIEQVVTTSDDYESQLDDSKIQITDLDAQITELDAQITDLDATVTTCQDAFGQSQKIVAAYIAAKVSDSTALGNFFSTYSFAAGDVGALYDAMDRTNQPILAAHAGLSAKCF